jgi:hypothetical protein
MSWSRSLRWPAAVALVLGLTARARAENVDWSEYVEKSPPASRKASAATTPAKSQVKPAARATKPVASKGKVKRQAKAQTRRK